MKTLIVANVLWLLFVLTHAAFAQESFRIEFNAPKDVPHALNRNPDGSLSNDSSRSRMWTRTTYQHDYPPTWRPEFSEADFLQPPAGWVRESFRFFGLRFTRWVQR